MKKIMMTLAAVLCCAMTTVLFTACDKLEEEGMKVSHWDRCLGMPHTPVPVTALKKISEIIPQREDFADLS